MQTNTRRKRIVVLFVLALMALAFPACGGKTENSGNQAGSLKKSLNAADEAAAIRTLQNIFRAETLYMTTHSGGYGTFDEMVKDGSLDQRFAGSAPVLAGYVFTIKLTPDPSGQPTAYSVNADPKEEPSAGARHLYMDSASNVVRGNPNRTAGPNDPPVSQ
ncbi:MAG: hypothetical protein M3362_09210 [Acidobacteriota bacterium]|nr:hypothetical protein [Acidobacteriota bacterium]